MIRRSALNKTTFWEMEYNHFYIWIYFILRGTFFFKHFQATFFSYIFDIVDKNVDYCYIHTGNVSRLRGRKW